MQDGMKLVGEVRGTELEAQTVMQATKYVIQAYCSSLAVSVCPDPTWRDNHL